VTFETSTTHILTQFPVVSGHADQDDVYEYDDDDDDHNNVHDDDSNESHSGDAATLHQLAHRLTPQRAAAVAAPAPAVIRTTTMRVRVPTGDAAAPFTERRVLVRRTPTPAVVLDAGDAGERVLQLKAGTLAAFEPLANSASAAAFRLWSPARLNPWAFTFLAATQSAMMELVNALEATGVVELLIDWTPDHKADALAFAARSTLAVEGHDEPAPVSPRTVSPVAAVAHSHPVPPPRSNAALPTGAARPTPTPPPKQATPVPPPKTPVVLQSLVAQKRDGLSQVTTTTTVTQETTKDASGQTVIVTTTRTAENRKTGLLAGLSASNSNVQKPALTPADRDAPRLAVDAPHGIKADWVYKMSSSSILGSSLQKRYCSIDESTHTLVYGEFGVVDAKSASKAGETVSSTYVATQKAQAKFKSGIAMLKGKLKNKGEPDAAAPAAAHDTVVFYQKGAIPLQECLLQSIDDERLHGLGAFGVGHRERTYVFVPLAVEDRDSWIAALRRAGATDGTNARMAPAATPPPASPRGSTAPLPVPGAGSQPVSAAASPASASAPPAPLSRGPSARQPGSTFVTSHGDDDSSTLSAGEAVSYVAEQARLAQQFADPQMVHGGMLVKISGIQSNVHYRWFALQRGGELVWGVFQRDKVQPNVVEFVQRGALQLRGAEAFRVTRVAAHGHREFGFAIGNAPGLDRSLELFAASEADILAWQRALRDAGCAWIDGHYELLLQFLARTSAPGVEAAVASDLARRKKWWSAEGCVVDPVAAHAARRERFANRIGEAVKFQMADSIRDDALFVD